ncbi:uncharacterized protein isoform X1 [Leptinotarsa decemlineata]|uniref:uncharacterized protein isoform X1 n=1 Tax=Leptinotarsa decemlineata TaxID=7539 RepID=UPI003D306947
MDRIKDELQFYSKFTRPLIFSLPDAKDRVRAAGWVKKIREDQSGNERLKTDYIKLLLFALQRKKLVGIFADDPDLYEKLEEFPPDFDLNSMARTLIQTEQTERVERIRKQLRGQIGDYPPYTTDCSSDFREYAAAQDIPGFGVHCYYAISREPINFWQRADRGIYPKITKSAVDSTSPLPPGVSGRTSDPSCVCPSAPGEVESSCKARVHKEREPSRRKRHKKKLGKSPPTSPLGTVPPPEERESPTWSSNLMEVRESKPVEESDAKPARSTGAIPKLRTEKDKKKALRRKLKGDDSDAEDAELKEMEDALEDYRRGEIRSRRKRARTRKKGLSEEEEEEDEDLEDQPLFEIIQGGEDVWDTFEDLDQSKFQEELDEDSALLTKFKDKLTKIETRRKLAERKQRVGSVSPAEAGIPLTTPKPSPSPKRQESSEKIYSEGPSEIPVRGEEPSRLPKKGLPSSMKDPKLHKLFEEAKGMPDEEKGEMPTGGGIPTGTGPQMQAAPEADKKTPAFDGKPMTPILRGSTQANVIFSEALDTFQSAATPSTPPIFSRDPKIRQQAQMQEYDDHLYEDVEEWIPAPQYFADEHEFVSYDPRDERRQIEEMFGITPGVGDDIFGDVSFELPKSPEGGEYDMFGLPKLVEVTKMPLSRSPVKPATPPFRFTEPTVPTDIFDITEAEMSLVGADETPTTPKFTESPGVAGYVTPERLKTTRDTPPSYVPTAYRPIPSPGEVKSPGFEDQFLFDVGQESPPFKWTSPGLSPPGSPGVNMLTVSEMKPGAGTVPRLPSENVFGVEILDEKTREKYIDFLFGEDEKMKELVKSISSRKMEQDLSGEQMPQLAEGVQVPSLEGRGEPLFTEFRGPYVTVADRMKAAREFIRTQLHSEVPTSRDRSPPPPIPSTPTRPLGPMYFPRQFESDGNYPRWLSPDLDEKLEDLERDEEFFDPKRGGMYSRFLIVGKTSTRRKDLGKSFAPKAADIITEESEEPPKIPSPPTPLSPRTPPVKVCPRTPPRQSPMRTSPVPLRPVSPPPGREPSPGSIFKEEYIPPMYVSPGAGILEESPPIIHEEDDDIRRDIVDLTKEPLPLTTEEYLRRTRMRNAAAYEELDRILSPSWSSRRERAVPKIPSPERVAAKKVTPRQATPRQVSPKQVTPKQATPPPATAGTPRIERRRLEPRRDLLEAQGAKRARRSRLTESTVGRRIDFTQPDPGELTEADRYAAEVLARSNLPPLSPPERPPKPSILDTWVPANLPSPIRPPTVVQGWKTPPHLAERPKTPPSPFRPELPDVHPDQWFFDLHEEPPFAPSPERYPEYEYVPQTPPEDIPFLDEGQPFLVPGAEFSPSVCGSPVCPGDMSFRSPLISPESPVTTPLRDFGGDIFTPPPGAGERTPITKADQIFQEYGIVDSPIEMVEIPPTPPPPPTPYSPLSDPVEMQKMMERVREAEGRSGIRKMITGEPQAEEEEPQHPVFAELRSFIRRKKEAEERREARREKLERRRVPPMPRIREYVSPVPYTDPHGLPFPKRVVVQPTSWADTYVSPEIAHARPLQVDRGDEMQRVIDDIKQGRLAHLDAIEVEGGMSPTLPPLPQLTLGITTPEHLKVQPVSPLGRSQEFQAIPRRVSPPPSMVPPSTPEERFDLRSPFTPPAQLWASTVVHSFGAQDDFGTETMEFPPSPGQLSPTRSPPQGSPARAMSMSPRQVFPVTPSPPGTPGKTLQGTPGRTTQGTPGKIPQGTPGRTPQGTLGRMSPGRMSPERTCPGRSPSPQEIIFDESFPGGFTPPGALSPTKTPQRRVTHRVSQRRIVTMLPTPNITPGTPYSGDLSDSFLAEDEANFKWMDRET